MSLGYNIISKKEKKGGAMHQWQFRSGQVDWDEVRRIMAEKRPLILEQIQAFFAEHPEFGIISFFDLGLEPVLQAQFYLHPEDKRRAEVFSPPHRIRDLRDEELDVLADFGNQLMEWDRTIVVMRVRGGWQEEGKKIKVNDFQKYLNRLVDVVVKKF